MTAPPKKLVSARNLQMSGPCQPPCKLAKEICAGQNPTKTKVYLNKNKGLKPFKNP
jgi:hypothetical protein